MRIAIATGTRADWGLLKPLADSLQNQGAQIRVIATHQHLLAGMGNTLTEIRDDGYYPAALVDAAGTPAEIMARAASGFATVLADMRPDCIIILGDRCEMLGVASAALLCGIPIVHIAGGTISEGAFDDSVRHAITKMATLHFPETQNCAQRILRMGENPDNVIAAGALGVYNALNVPLMDFDQLETLLGDFQINRNFMVVTLHTATLAGGEPIHIQQNLLDALEQFLPELQFIITYPNSDVDPAPLIASLHAFEREYPLDVKVVPSLGRVGYLSAASLSSGVVGNSSSALVEIPSLGVPSLDIGIRQKGREHGPSITHCGISTPEIAEGIRKILSPEVRKIASRRENPYFRDDTPNLMASRILSYPFSPFPQKKFFRYPPDMIE